MKIAIALVLILTSCASDPQLQGSCPVLGNCEDRSDVVSLKESSMFVLQPMIGKKGKSTLIGGKPAEPADWPASVYASTKSSSCSATIVGDRVVLIAAHCVTTLKEITFTAGVNNYKARCDVHPLNKKNQTADWSLCLTDRPVIGIKFESVLSDSSVLALGQELLLTGYGCIRPGGGGGNDGVFRIGPTRVVGLPRGANFQVVTKGGAALCFGDSGGAAYVVTSPNERHVIGINSAGDINSVSYLSSTTASKVFTDWAIGWSIAKTVMICGMHEAASGCRSGGNQPDANTRFEVAAESACVRGAVRAGFIDQKDEIVKSVLHALESFKEKAL